jgi:hypothetical protein
LLELIVLVPELNDLDEPDIYGVALDLDECRALIPAHGMSALLLLIFDFLDLRFPGLKNLVNIPGDLPGELDVVQVHDLPGGDNFEDLVGEVAAECLDKLELPGLWVDLLLVAHVAYLLENLGQRHIDLRKVIGREEVVDGDLSEHTVVPLDGLEDAIQLEVVGEHQNQLVLVGTLKQVEGHFDFRLLNLLLDVSQAALQRDVEHDFLQDRARCQVVLHLSDTCDILEPLLDAALKAVDELSIASQSDEILLFHPAPLRFRFLASESNCGVNHQLDLGDLQVLEALVQMYLKLDEVLLHIVQPRVGLVFPALT